MIQCSCGKTIERVPVWMSQISVTFVCNNCPNRQTKNIAFITLETETPKTDLPDDAQPEEAKEEEA